MFRKLGFLVFLFLPFFGKSQDSAVYSVGADLNYHPQDFFFHVRGQLLKRNLSHEVFIGFGINKTLFQKQMNPRIGYDFSYRFKLTGWFSVSPVIRLSYSMLNTRAPEKHPLIHTTESFAACRLMIGNRNRFAVTGGIGPAIEWKYDAYSGGSNHFFMWNYFAEITYYYEF